MKVHGSTRFALLGESTSGRSFARTCLRQERAIARAGSSITWLSRRVTQRSLLMLFDAFFQAPETENVVVYPPLEYLKRLEDAGEDTNVKWKVLKQLPGQRTCRTALG